MLSIDEAWAPAVSAARPWVETPYVHQHQTLGIGCDCVGLIKAVREVITGRPISDAAWEPWAGYGRQPNPRKMVAAMHKFMVPLALERKPAKLPPDGAVMHMGWRDHLPMHLAILASDRFGRRTMIHSYEPAGKVAEHGFGLDWPSRVISWWAFPDLPLTGLEAVQQEGA